MSAAFPSRSDGRNNAHERGKPDGRNNARERGKPDRRNNARERGKPDRRNNARERGKPDGRNNARRREKSDGRNNICGHGNPRQASPADPPPPALIFLPETYPAAKFAPCRARFGSSSA